MKLTTLGAILTLAAVCSGCVADPFCIEPLANPLQVQQLLITKKCKNCTLRDINLAYTNTNLASADLRSARLGGAVLNDVNLHGANLQEADFSPSENTGFLASCRWNSASLIRADLSGANLKGANLEGANLEYANLEGANLQGAIYSKSTIFPKGFDPIANKALLKPEY
jgi:uncharacterized protein YjbI with pentapeptide repeats